MNYYSKFIKYQNKLYGGNKVDSLASIFNAYFDKNWILTGSEAIKKYLEHFKIVEFEFPTNDVDIFYISKDQLNSRNIGGYIRKQNQTESSMTFENKETNTSFDITVIKGSRYYYEIDGIKLDTPENMLENYEENIELRNNPTDLIKINALKKIKELVNPNTRLTLYSNIELEKKRKSEILMDSPTANRLRFTHIDVDAKPSDEPQSPIVGRMKLSDLF